MNDPESFMADKEALRTKAKSEGAMLYEPPNPETMTAVEDDYERQYKCAEALNLSFQELLAKFPDKDDDELRTYLCKNNSGFAAFSRENWTVFTKFTDRSKNEDIRKKMLLTILVACKVSKGTLDPSEAQAVLSNLMGVDEAKREEIRSQLR